MRFKNVLMCKLGSALVSFVGSALRIYIGYFRINRSSASGWSAGGVAGDGHVEVVFLAEGGDGGHHGGGVVAVDGFLAGPAVDEQEGLGVVERLVILVAQVALLGADGGDGAAGGHLLGELQCVAVNAGILYVYCYRHLFLFVVSTASGQQDRRQKGYQNVFHFSSF